MNKANPFAAPEAELDDLNTVVQERQDHELADRGPRFLARFIDGLLLMAVIFASGLGAGALGSDMTWLFVLVPTLGFVGIQGYLLTVRGQTLGKKWVGIRIVDIEGRLPGFGKAVLVREIAMLIAIQLLNLMIGVGGILGLVDSLFIFRQDRRCIHDLLAGTRVVTGQP